MPVTWGLSFVVPGLHQTSRCPLAAGRRLADGTMLYGCTCNLSVDLTACDQDFDVSFTGVRRFRLHDLNPRQIRVLALVSHTVAASVPHGGNSPLSSCGIKKARPRHSRFCRARTRLLSCSWMEPPHCWQGSGPLFCACCGNEAMLPGPRGCLLAANAPGRCLAGAPESASPGCSFLLASHPHDACRCSRHMSADLEESSSCTAGGVRGRRVLRTRRQGRHPHLL